MAGGEAVCRPTCISADLIEPTNSSGGGVGVAGMGNRNGFAQHSYLVRARYPLPADAASCVRAAIPTTPRATTRTRRRRKRNETIPRLVSVRDDRPTRAVLDESISDWPRKACSRTFLHFSARSLSGVVLGVMEGSSQQRASSTGTERTERVVPT
jgi:hypothetical protein